MFPVDSLDQAEPQDREVLRPPAPLTQEQERGSDMFRIQERLVSSGWALLPLRLLVGFGFAAHGYAKLSRGPENFAAILAALGVPHPHAMAWLTALLEFAGGISVMAGAFVLLLSAPLIAIMLTALVTVHLQYGFSSVRLKAITASGVQFGPIGYEMNLLYIAGLLTLAMCGAGALSWDRVLANRKLSMKPSPENRGQAVCL